MEIASKRFDFRKQLEQTGQTHEFKDDGGHGLIQ